MNQVIAVPCEMPGGIGAPMSAHFGHCAAFTLVTLAGEEVTGVEVVANPDHQHGGCMVPVDLLRGHGATHVVAAGMGRRPLIAMLDRITSYNVCYTKLLRGISGLASRTCTVVGRCTDVIR